MNQTRYIIGFFAVLILMVSGGLDAMAHTAGVPTPQPLSIILFGAGLAVLRLGRWRRRVRRRATAVDLSVRKTRGGSTTADLSSSPC